MLADMAWAQARGHPSPVWGAYTLLHTFFTAAQVSSTPGVCASVVLRLSQRFVVERQAFLASLTLGCPSAQNLVNVSFALRVTDAAGRDVTADFAFTAPSLAGFTQGLFYAEGLGLAGGASGTAEVTLASRNFALNSSASFFVAGWVGYTTVMADGQPAGSPENITLVAAEIQVHPEPQLRLGYYVPQWIAGDNPFTEVRGLADGAR